MKVRSTVATAVTIVASLIASVAALATNPSTVAAQVPPEIGPGTSEDPCATAPVDGFGFDRYGGWKGLSRPATGRFTVARVDGRWWFFTPDGNAFYANGPTGIRPSGGGATATGANAYLDGILATHGSTQAWADATFPRTCELGIRTLGGWNSMENLPLFAGRMAYTVNIDVYSAMPAVTTGPAGLKPRRDVHVADAAARAAGQAANPLVARCAGDPWCLGVFVENEQPYAPAVTLGGSYLDVYLSQPAGSPGKTAVQRVLTARHHGDLVSFNSTWGTTLTSFDEIQGLTKLGTCPTDVGIADDQCAFAESTERVADRIAVEADVAATIARLADDALDDVDPAMLNLGPRLVLEPHLPQVLQELTAPVDVVSVNNYDVRSYAGLLAGFPPPGLGALSYDPFDRLDQLASISDKPIYVTEWFYRLRRPDVASHPFFLPEVVDGEAQAAAVTAYLDRLHAMPSVVGDAWFQWADQPVEGRASDGENQLHGIVDITDTVRQPLFDTMAALNHDVVGRRLDAPTAGPFTARVTAAECGVLSRLAEANDTTPDAILRFGVHLLDTVPPVPASPRHEPASTCEITVEWTEDDVEVLRRVGAAWGLGADDLHAFGGRLVLAIIWWLAVQG